MYRAIAKKKRNTVFIVLIFLVIVGALGFAASAIWNNGSIGFLVLGGAAVYAVIQYFAASGQALSMSNAQQVDGGGVGGSGHLEVVEHLRARGEQGVVSHVPILPSDP